MKEDTKYSIQVDSTLMRVEGDTIPEIVEEIQQNPLRIDDAWRAKSWIEQREQDSNADVMSDRGANAIYGVIVSLITLLIALNIRALVSKVISMFGQIIYTRHQNQTIPARILPLFSFTVIPLISILINHYLNAGIIESSLLSGGVMFFIWIYISLILFILLRRLIFKGIEYTAEAPDLFKTIEQISFLSLFTLTLLFLVPIPFKFLFSDFPSVVIEYYLIIVTSVITIIYLILIIRQIIKERVYVFFGFLYLCTLELLPMTLLIKAFLITT